MLSHSSMTCGFRDEALNIAIDVINHSPYKPYDGISLKRDRMAKNTFKFIQECLLVILTCMWQESFFKKPSMNQRHVSFLVVVRK